MAVRAPEAQRPELRWPVLAVLALGLLLRLLYLDADPHYYEWKGYITDEGRWVQNARSLALGGTLFEHEWNLHFFLAPLFQLANYAVFAVGGVSFLTARLLTAVSGCAILLLFWGLLRATATPAALLVGLALLAVQPDLVMLSRVAVPEMAVMLLQLLVYALVVAGRPSWRRLALAGLLLAAAVGTKITVIWMLPIFSAVVLAVSRREAGARRWAPLAAFWLGAGAPLLAVGLVGISPAGARAASLESYVRTIEGHLRLAGLYDIVSFPMDDLFARTLNLWGLGLWLGVVGWITARPGEVEERARRHLLASAVWLGLFIPLAVGLWYFPTRYKVHVLIPMAVAVTVGLSTVQRVGIRAVTAFFQEAGGTAGTLSLSVLSLPAAVFLAPLLASLGGLAGLLRPERLRAKVFWVVVALVAVTWLARRWRGRGWVVGFLLTFPVVAALAWLVLDAAGAPGFSFWPREDLASHLVWWLPFLGVSALAAAALARGLPRWDGAGCVRLMTAGAACYLGVSLVGIAPGYLEPHYTLRETSRDLGRLLAGFPSIVTLRGEGMFTENALRYDHFNHRRTISAEGPRALVVTRGDLDGAQQRAYRLLKNYDLYISPEYYRRHPEERPAGPLGERVSIYTRD